LYTVDPLESTEYILIVHIVKNLANTWSLATLEGCIHPGQPWENRLQTHRGPAPGWRAARAASNRDHHHEPDAKPRRCRGRCERVPLIRLLRPDVGRQHCEVIVMLSQQRREQRDARASESARGRRENVGAAGTAATSPSIHLDRTNSFGRAPRRACRVGDVKSPGGVPAEP